MGADRGASSGARGVCRGGSGADNRLFVDAVLWLARTASPWRDLPPEFGKWTGVHARFRRWVMAGVWERLFNELSADPDFEYILIDSTICKDPRRRDGRKGGTSSSGDRTLARRSDDETPRRQWTHWDCR